MANVRRMMMVGMVSLCAGSGLAFGAGWDFEGAAWNNQLATPDGGMVYTFDIGNVDRTWYWYGAGNISFRDSAGDGSGMYWQDESGGSPKWEAMKFEFSRAIRTFQFVTPYMVNHRPDVTWSYSTDGTNWTTIWHRDWPGGYMTYDPEYTPVQTFGPDSTVTRIYLRYQTGAGFAQATYFNSGADDGGLLIVETEPDSGWLPGVASVEGSDTWNNVLETPAGNTSYSFVITGTTRQVWYWENAGGISFYPHYWNDINAGIVKYESMKFLFTRSITSFQFTLPTMVNHRIDPGNSLNWDYSADNGMTWHSLWKYVGVDSAFHTFGPEVLPAVQLAAPTDRIRLRYYEEQASYCAAVLFGPADGGKMTVRTEPTRVAVQGVVNLQGYLGDNDTISVKLRFEPVGEGYAQTRIAHVSADGTFQVTDVPEGVYDIVAKAYASLAARMPNVVISGNPSVLPEPIVLGGADVNGDNTVSFEDFSVLQNSYGQSGVSAVNPLGAAAAGTGGCGPIGVTLMSILALAFFRLGLRNE